MATRASIRIVQRLILGKSNRRTKCVINLYHHWDGNPEYVGKKIKKYLKDTWCESAGGWFAETIATEIVQGAIKEIDRRSGEEVPDLGYKVSSCVHGDINYGYEIDCDAMTLKCYRFPYGSDKTVWKEEYLVEIPD